jgi:signal transduction histidine kinase
MPGVDGFETAAHMRGLEKTSDVPIIFLTAISKDMDHRMRGYSLGAFDYVFKPFEPEVLRSKVSVLVELYEKKQQLKDQARMLAERLDEETRLNRALDDFSGWVAHDLRTPLTLIGGAMEVIATRVDPNDESAQTLVELALKRVASANQLITRLLELAKASGTPRREPIDMKELIADASAGVDGLELETGPLVDQIVADRTSVSQALVNLLANARRHAALSGTATVTVSAQATAEGWTLCVADRGPGLGKDEEDAVFERFRSSDESPQGTGLGLAIVAATAEAHGGRAWYEPRPGGGSCFYISISDSRPRRRR